MTANLSDDKGEVFVAMSETPASSEAATVVVKPTNSLSNDNAQVDDGKINKQISASSSSSAERNDSPREIASGNCVAARCQGEKSDEKINTPKKRFFDLKRTAESIQSMSPSRLAHSLTPKLLRKNAASNKLSQLEQQSNLFIRDGAEQKTNKPEEGASTTGSASCEANLCRNFPNDGINGEITTAPDAGNDESSSSENFSQDKGEESNCDELSRPEFSSNVFKNIPVRQRKGQVPHMENYCLFDPSVDFCNEKELRKRNFQDFANFTVVYDVSEHDEQKALLAHHNYYEIDPELFEQDEKAARKSSSSSSSGDYPSICNETTTTTTTSSVTIESTDENACGKSSGAISQAEVRSEITIVTATGATSKLLASRNPTDDANHQQTKAKSAKINLPFDFDPLRASHSLPQLQSITVRQERSAVGDYKIEINNRTTIQLKRIVKRARPLSSESLDSGFTTPSPPNEAQPSSSGPSGDKSEVDNLNSTDTKQPVKGGESTVLTQCDNIQQLIEVSNEPDKRPHLH